MMQTQRPCAPGAQCVRVHPRFQYDSRSVNESLDHLPKEHQADLARLVGMVRGEVDDVDMVILFGSFARGDWKAEADLPPPEERRSGHPSDYDILVVTRSAAAGSDAALWERLSQKTRRMKLQTHARIIGYDITTLNERLQDGRYFHTDIVKEGKVLYGSGSVTLAGFKELPAEKRKKLSQEYFEEGMATANGFFNNYNDSLGRSELKLAAFHLHQATEFAYKTILLVFTHYSPHEHLLEILGHEAAKHAPPGAIRGVFPMSTKEDRDRFMQLDYAYIGARYDKSYSISREDLEKLATCVRTLLERAKAACEAELKKMG